MSDAEGQLALHTSVEGSVARVRLHGELDVHAAGAVIDELTGLVSGDVRTVIVDVSGLTFLDSTGLRALLVGRDHVRDEGAEFSLQGVGGVVERVLEMTGLHDLLTGNGTEDPAPTG